MMLLSMAEILPRPAGGDTIPRPSRKRGVQIQSRYPNPELPMTTPPFPAFTFAMVVASVTAVTVGGGQITGVVHDPEGRPLKGAQVVLVVPGEQPVIRDGKVYSAEGGPELKETTTNAEGRFVLA